ncbi:hypothetical protein ACSQ67_015771 [Phaseolus vulgaris]
MSSGSVTNAPPSSSSSPNSSTESPDGLKFGQKIYFEDVSVAAAATTQGTKTSGGISSSSSSSKKGRGGSAQPAQPSRCQVQGCNVDLSGAKAYYSRHKVCAMHSKSPTVIVASLEQRFCQQCSRSPSFTSFCLSLSLSLSFHFLLFLLIHALLFIKCVGSEALQVCFVFWFLMLLNDSRMARASRSDVSGVTLLQTVCPYLFHSSSLIASEINFLFSDSLCRQMLLGILWDVIGGKMILTSCFNINLVAYIYFINANILCVSPCSGFICFLNLIKESEAAAGDLLAIMSAGESLLPAPYLPLAMAGFLPLFLEVSIISDFALPCLKNIQLFHSCLADNNGRAGSFLMEFASYPKLSLRNTLPTPRSDEPLPGNHAAALTWQGSSETASEFFLHGSGSGGTSFLGSKHPLMESYTTDSNCALSLLSNQTWGSRTTQPSVELNNNNHNLLNFNGSSMAQFTAASSQVAAMHQLPNATSWYLKAVDSPEDVPDLGLGQISPSLHSHLHGELDVPHQGRHYMDLEESRACESSHWSL